MYGLSSLRNRTGSLPRSLRLRVRVVNNVGNGLPKCMADFCNTPSYQQDRSPNFPFLQEILVLCSTHPNPCKSEDCIFYELFAVTSSMGDDDLDLIVRSTRKKTRFGRELLKEILAVLVRDQFIPQGNEQPSKLNLNALSNDIFRRTEHSSLLPSLKDFGPYRGLTESISQVLRTPRPLRSLVPRTAGVKLRSTMP